MDFSITVRTLPIIIALIADGTVIAITSNLYRRNAKTVDEFRDQLRKTSFRKPRYGFVIPMYRNPEEVDRCLDDLIRRVGVPNSEIIAVDDFSNDEGQTKRAAERHGVEVLEINQLEKDVRKIRAQRKGVQKWLKRGREYVVCLDSDCYLRAELTDLELAMVEMEYFDLDAMGGQVLPRIDKTANLLERIQFAEYKQTMRACRGFMYMLDKPNEDQVGSTDGLRTDFLLKQASQLTISGAFGIFKPILLKQVLDEMKVYGGGEDTEITLRLLAKGAKMGYNDGIIVETEVPDNLVAWLRQRHIWSQFSLSYFYDSDYIQHIFVRKGSHSQWKPSYDLGGLSFGLQILRDVTHPLKLVSFPFLMANLFSFAVLMIVHTGLSWYCSNTIKHKEEETDWLAELMLPYCRLGQLIGPITVGYTKQFVRIFDRRGRSKNREDGSEPEMPKEESAREGN